MTPATCKVAAIEKYGEPVVIREAQVPEPEPGALVVRMAAATMCGTELHLWRGDYEQHGSDFHIDLPVVPGHEGVGEVVALGSGADVDSVGQPLKLGDRVVWAHGPCGHCYACNVLKEETLCLDRKVGMFTNCDNFPYVGGTFGEYAYVWPEAGRLRVPDEVGSEVASAASCALRSVVQALVRIGDIDYRHNVVIQGVGPLGLFATAVIATKSPRRLVVIGDPRERLELARSWGADAAISISETADPVERLMMVKEETDGRGPDVLIEVTGSPIAFAEGLEMAAQGARYLVVGNVAGPTHPVAPHYITNRQLTIMGSSGAGIDGYYHALEFLRAHRDRFAFEEMLTGRYRLDQVTDAITNMAAGKEIKPVILTQGQVS